MTDPNAGAVLAGEIERELKEIDHVVELAQGRLAALGEAPADEFVVRAFGSLLHDAYSGYERIFRLIADEIDGTAPSGEDWHSRMLRQMAIELPAKRPVVIEDALWPELQDLMGFRHVFRHNYGHRLKWERVRELAVGLPETHREVRSALERFSAFLRSITPPATES